jgi:hypothetical protein
MNDSKKQKKKKNDISIKKIEIDIDIRLFIGIVLMFLLLFILPIRIIYYLNNPNEFGLGVLGITSDNSGRYLNIPLFNFQFDTTLREPQTITFVFIILVLLISIILITVFFIDFKNREKKYKY